MLTHRKAVLLFGDILVLVASLGVMAFIRFDVGSQGSHIWQQIQLFGLLFVVWLIVFFIFDLYSVRHINPNPLNIGLLVVAMVINALLGVLLFYLVPSIGISPKTTLVILSVTAFMGMVLWRRLFYILFTRQFVRRILIIGTTPLIDHLTNEMTQHRHIGSVVATWQTIPRETPRLAVDLIIADGVDPVLLLQLSRQLNTETLSLVEAYETIFGKIPVELMTHEKALHLMTNRVPPGLHFVYRLGEIIIASLVLVITAPFMLIALIARWIEDGTPFFIKQTRVGKDGVAFTIYKIRSMKALSPDGSAESTGAQWADKKDHRITPVGNILRTTHLDEVPQMYNIIKGDLALIGPRAERPEFVAVLEKEIPYYYLRHTTRPGFTGWAQIKFRYARTIDDSREKFEYDLYYLKNKHPLLDIGILFKTLQIIFTH